MKVAGLDILVFLGGRGGSWLGCGFFHFWVFLVHLLDFLFQKLLQVSTWWEGAAVSAE